MLIVGCAGCVEDDPCFFPSVYDACVEPERLAGCPGYGPLVLGPWPNVPSNYNGGNVEYSDQSASYVQDWEVGDAQRGIEYMSPTDDNNNDEIHYGFELHCEDNDGDSQDLHLYLWVLARVTTKNTGFRLHTKWQGNASERIIYDEVREDYAWISYTDPDLDLDRAIPIDEDQMRSWISIDPDCGEHCEDCSKRCSAGTVEGIARVVISGEAAYDPRGSMELQ